MQPLPVAGEGRFACCNPGLGRNLGKGGKLEDDALFVC